MAKIKSSKDLTPEQQNFYRSIRMIVVSKQPYISDAIFRLIPVSSPGLKTMAVDKKWRVYIDFEYMMEKGREYSAATLAHEPWHLLRNHWRRAEEIGASGDHWNHAGDLEINDDILTLITSDFLIPGEGMYSHLEKGRTAEEYYYDINPDDIPPREEEDNNQEEDDNSDNNDDTGNDDNDDSSDDGENSDSDSGSGEEAGNDPSDSLGGSDGSDGSDGDDNSDTTNDLEIGKCGTGASGGDKASYELSGEDDNDPDTMVTEAEEVSIRVQVAENIKTYALENPSEVDEGVKLWAEEQLAHKPLNWRKVISSVLKHAMRHTSGQQDYNWSRPNRRQPIPGILLPSMKAPKPRIAVGIDTSGSNLDKLGIVSSEIKNMLNKAGIKGRDMLAFSVDSHIEGKPNYINDLDDITYTGAGGTDMNKAFDLVAEKLHKDIDIFILMTDGEYLNWYEQKPRGTGRITYITCIIVDSKAAPSVTKQVIQNAEKKLTWSKLVIVDIANM